MRVSVDRAWTGVRLGETFSPSGFLVIVSFGCSMVLSFRPASFAASRKLPLSFRAESIPDIDVVAALASAVLGLILSRFE